MILLPTNRKVFVFALVQYYHNSTALYSAIRVDSDRFPKKNPENLAILAELNKNIIKDKEYYEAILTKKAFETEYVLLQVAESYLDGNMFQDLTDIVVKKVIQKPVKRRFNPQPILKINLNLYQDLENILDEIQEEIDLEESEAA
jgi:hypothetical protein